MYCGEVLAAESAAERDTRLQQMSACQHGDLQRLSSLQLNFNFRSCSPCFAPCLLVVAYGIVFTASSTLFLLLPSAPL